MICIANVGTLLRLKELEALEKVTEKVDKLTVFGGLEGVMQDVVKLNAKAEWAMTWTYAGN